MQKEQEFELQQLRNQEHREELDRVTAVQHIQTESFSRHVKLEGYGDNAAGQTFGCDRLMKQESMFSRIQLGYNASRQRAFLFAELKTSRYDTVNSRHQRTMKEYQMNSRERSAGTKKAFVSRKRGETALLIEKSYGRPWSEETIYRHYDRLNTEVLALTMPFLDRKRNRLRLEELRENRRALQEQIQRNTNEGRFQENTVLRKEQTQKLTEEAILQHLILHKEAFSRNFMNKVNLVYETQKHQIFEYYKNRREKEQKESEGNAAAADDISEEEQA